MEKKITKAQLLEHLEFWKQVYVAATAAGMLSPEGRAQAADKAVEILIKRLNNDYLP